MLAIALTILAIMALAVADLRGVLVLSFPIYSLVSTAVALSILESGAYVSEQGRYGSNIGATPLFCLYAIAFLTFTHLALIPIGSSLRGSRLKLNPNSLSMFIVALAVGITVFYLIVFERYGFGTSYRTRFDWERQLPFVVRRIHVVTKIYASSVMFFLAGVLWRVYGFRRWAVRSVVLLPPLLALAATGEKFSMYAFLICIVLVGVGVGGYLCGERQKIRIRSVTLVGTAVIALIAPLSLGYRRMGTASVTSAVRERVALQGHVWYGILDRFNGAPTLSLGQILGRNTLQSPAGLDLLSYFVADRNFVYNRLSYGVTFTMGGPPSALAVFGSWAGVFAYALTGLLYAAVIWLTVKFLKNGRIILASCAIGLYVVVGTATQMGRWDDLYGPVVGGAALMIAVVSIVFRGQSVRTFVPSGRRRTGTRSGVDAMRAPAARTSGVSAQRSGV